MPNLIKKNKNANLTYISNGIFYQYDLWVTSLEQDLSLNGTSQKSRLTSHFYPQNLVLGDLQVGGICGSQEEYQGLSLFIRQHQLALLNQTPGQHFLPQQSGAGLLLNLKIPSEGVLYGGYCSTFTITKKGVFDPAPTYTFAYTIIIDPHTTDISVSTELQKWSTASSLPPLNSSSVDPGASNIWSQAASQTAQLNKNELNQIINN